eukprot:TRINITY_DN1964_c0_g2_i1.p1 TRINITY_DN1964_c0_g2~~TRINITY_DN1964_c0_g2_i1.p1  ORF type:complete len:319 (+),score=82.44 TRINITY_DN1964_c0_g2_i1:55-957(+)
MSADKKKCKLIDPVFTCYNPDGSVNTEKVVEQTAFCKAQGVDAVFVTGTTGEGLSLTVAERKQIAQAWKKNLDPSIELYFQVGCQALPDAVELAAYAQEIGVTGIAAYAPSYHRPPTLDALIKFLQPIAGAAPKLPFYYYHFPALTGVHFSVYDVLKNGKPHIPTLSGAKFTHIDLEDFTRSAALDGGKFELWAGYGATMGIASMQVGGKGCFFYTYLAPLFRELREKYYEGKLDDAVKLQNKLVDINGIQTKFGGLPAAKSHYNTFIDAGTLRPALQSLSKDQEQEYFALIKPLLDLGK